MSTVPVVTLLVKPDCGYCGAEEQASVFVEAEEDRGLFVARCGACFDAEQTAADLFEARYLEHGVPAPPPFEISRGERKEILTGRCTKLLRLTKPDVKQGEVLVVSYRGGGKQFLARTDEDRKRLADEGKPVTIDVPREPSVWLVFREPQVKDGEWVTSFHVEDLRERVRTLGPSAPPAGPSQSGLRTRWGQTVNREGKTNEKRVPERGEQKTSFTPESERGYGGGGKSTVDEREGVDDGTLEGFALKAAGKSADLRKAKLLERRVRALESELEKAEAKERTRTVQTIKLELSSNRQEIAALRKEHGL